MSRIAAKWFIAAGAIGLSLYVVVSLLLEDAEYYDASTFGDYVFVTGVTTILVLAGVPLVLLWRDPPVSRGSFLLLTAGLGAIAEGLGNFLEDVFDVEAAVWLFFGGGIVLMLSLLGAGILALTVNSPDRWSGLFLLLGVPGGMLGFGWVVLGVSWILFGFWILHRHRYLVVATAAAVVPLGVVGILLNT